MNNNNEKNSQIEKLRLDGFMTEFDQTYKEILTPMCLKYSVKQKKKARYQTLFTKPALLLSKRDNTKQLKKKTLSRSP